ncbi:MAG: SUMF1/EgtB/PvdO family nonheme iron enzyme [Myxococcales bacterium]|nr:SUMF1/EgtB/PvdO family nonheme iron enzyme [Myxococcales bacterium]
MNHKDDLRRFQKHLFFCFFCFAALLVSHQSGCILEQLELTGRPCFRDPRFPNQAPCLEGWECNTATQKCVKAGTIEPVVELVNEPITEKTPDGGESTTPEEASNPEEQVSNPEEAIVEKTPDKTGPQCPYTKAAERLACPVSAQADCERFAETFVASTEELPKALVGAAAVSNGFRRRVDQDSFTKKVFVYVVGGSADGSAGDETFISEVSTQNKLGAWTAGPKLNTARTQASVFLDGNAILVVGGKGSDGKPVAAVERAEIKSDGSLDTFRSIGNWSSIRLEAGLVYQYGYLYMAGGVDGAGTAVAEGERVLVKPDGTLGTPEPTASLPAADKGYLLTTHHFLYFLSTDTKSRKVLISRILPDGTLEGWCETTGLPDAIVSFQAVADARRLFVYGVKDGSDKLDGQLYFAPVKDKQGSTDPYGGSLDSWFCSRNAQLQVTQATPRELAAAVIARDAMFLIGGKDKDGTALKTAESAALQFRVDSQCDLDRDGRPNTFDFCPDVFEPSNKNSDQPATVNRPTAPGWIESFGLGDACEFDQMVLVPAGDFKRGSGKNPDEPLGDVTLNGFYIDPYEVSIKDYKECVTQGKCTDPSDKSSGTISDYYDNAQYADRPVIHVTWDQAKAYCTFRGKRLPTEAEWEKAARSQDQRSYPWGSDSPDCQKSNYKDCPDKNTIDVSSLPGSASPYKAFHMAGNVREWVADFYDADAYKNGSTQNPTGPSSGQKRVVRGGSYLSTDAELSSTKRDSADPGTGVQDIGFRCARSLFYTP